MDKEVISIFDDNIIEEDNIQDNNAKIIEKKKTPSVASLFFNKHKTVIILSITIIIIVLTLSVAIYFVNKKGNNTTRKYLEELNNEQNKNKELFRKLTTAETINKKYCEEAQRLRASLKMLEDGNEQDDSEETRLNDNELTKYSTKRKKIKSMMHKRLIDKDKNGNEDKVENDSKNITDKKVKFNDKVMTEKDINLDTDNINYTDEEDKINLDDVIEN